MKLVFFPPFSPLLSLLRGETERVPLRSPLLIGSPGRRDHFLDAGSALLARRDARGGAPLPVDTLPGGVKITLRQRSAVYRGPIFFSLKSSARLIALESIITSLMAFLA